MARALRRPAARLLYGTHAIDLLGAELAKLSIDRALLVCGGTLGGDAELIGRLTSAAGTRIASVFSGVRAHSPIASVNEGVAVIERERIDGIVVLGGGSALVTGRAMAILAAEGGEAPALATRRKPDGTWHSPRLDAPKLPILALPTIPTTAIATAGTALTIPGYDGRYALFDPKARVRTIIVDRELVTTAPETLVRSAVRNGLAMAIEGLLSNEACLFSDAAMAQAARVYLRYFADAASVGRVDLTLAGIMTGEGAELASVGLTAALSHVIGHRFGVANGDLDALLLRYVLAHLTELGHPVDARLTAAGLATTDRVLAILESDSSIPPLTAAGINEADLPSIAEAAMTDFAYSTSPILLSREDVETILRAAFHAA